MNRNQRCRNPSRNWLTGSDNIVHVDFRKLAGKTKRTDPDSKPVKPLLRYPGGKSRFAGVVHELVKDYRGTICSPFMGGGAIELDLASRGVEVRGYDAWRPLVNFWRCVLRDSGRVAAMTRRYHPVTREDYYRLREEYRRIKSPYERAAIFFCLNRTCFCGITFRGYVDSQNSLTPDRIDLLQSFHVDNLTVQLSDFQDSIAANPDAMLLVDPPYFEGEAGYGYRGELERIDHEALHDLLRRRDDWLLFYDDCPDVRRMYRGYRTIRIDGVYRMRRRKRAAQLLIINADVNESVIRKLAG